MIVSCKIPFHSPDHAREVQVRLLEHGFQFQRGKQEPRQCVGVTVYKKELRSIASIGTFRAIAAKELQDLEELLYVPPPKPKPAPKPKSENPNIKQATREQRQQYAAYASQVRLSKKEAELHELIPHVLEALVNTEKRHGKYLFDMNSRSRARLAAWEYFAKEVARISKSYPSQLTFRRACRMVFDARKETYLLPDSTRIRQIMKQQPI